MEVPLLARSVAAAVGGLLVLTTGVSVVATLIVPPARRRLVDQLGPTSRRQNVSVPDLRHCGLQETGSAEGRRRRIEPHRSTDRLAGRGRGRVRASVLAVHIGRLRSGAHTRGLVVVHPRVRGPAERRSRVIVYLAAASGLIIVSLQIAYLPTLCGAFNRRETEVALLNARSGVPSWGPELLARTHYALGSGVSTLDTLLDLYARWERWAADVAELGLDSTLRGVSQASVRCYVSSPKRRLPIFSAASRCIVGVTWLYRLVKRVGSAWPRRSDATFGGTPPASINVALVWRRPWAVSRGNPNSVV